MSPSGIRRPSQLRRREVPLRTSLWFVPLLFGVGAALLSVITNRLDAALIRSGRIFLPGLLGSYAPEDVRAILATIAGAIVTVIALVAAMLALVFTLAVQQFGSRVMRNYLRDIKTQVTLGLFVATYVFTMLTLTQVNSRDVDPFVPNFSATVAIFLALASAGALVLFIHHVAVQIQASYTVAHIGRELSQISDRIAPGGVEPLGATPPDVQEATSKVEHDGRPVPAIASGYIQRVRHEELIAAAERAAAIVSLRFRPGEFVLQGEAVAATWPAERADQIADALSETVAIGPYRTLRQDPGFAADQLVDVALRALSAAINDTSTAIACIDWLGHLLRTYGERPAPPIAYRGTGGAVRLLVQPRTVASLVDSAIGRIRSAGRGNQTVEVHLLGTIERLAAFLTGPDERAALRDQADRTMAAAETDALINADRREIRVAHERAIVAIDAAAVGGAGGSEADRA